MDKQLKKIAAAARREMENFVRKHDKYNVGDLCCYCAISSFFLIMLGRKFGYKMTLIEGSAFAGDMKFEREGLENGEVKLSDIMVNHCWVEYDGMIIDLTATQFQKSLKKVHVVEANNKEYLGLNKNNKAKANFRSIWPDEQSPYFYLSELQRRAKKVEEKLSA